jgi:hypothetical protein
MTKLRRVRIAHRLKVYEKGNRQYAFETSFDARNASNVIVKTKRISKKKAKDRYGVVLK